MLVSWRVNQLPSSEISSCLKDNSLKITVSPGDGKCLFVLVAILFTSIVAYFMCRNLHILSLLFRIPGQSIACLFSQRNGQTDLTWMVWHFQMRDVKVETTYHLPPVLPFAIVQRPIDVVQR